MSLSPYVEPEPHAPEIPLLGGDVSVGVVRVGDSVRRPTGPHSPVVHAVLTHLEAVGFDGAPRLLGIDRQGREVLTFVDGEVAGRPAPDWVADEDRLDSVARLLRRYDDAMIDFSLPADLAATAALPEVPGMPAASSEPDELVGHQDVTLENVVFRDGTAVALIDFDLAKPCSRLLEVGNALLWWAPLTAPGDRDLQLVDIDVPARCRRFADAYGLPVTDRARLVPVLINRGRRSWFLMRHRAETRGGGWARMWNEGVGDVINRRTAWLEEAGDEITSALLAP